MLRYATLRYTTLYYTILYYTILYYTILYYTILYYTILYYTILYYTILCYTILYRFCSYSVKVNYVLMLEQKSPKGKKLNSFALCTSVDAVICVYTSRMAQNLANSVRKCWKCNIGKELFTIMTFTFCVVEI